MRSKKALANILSSLVLQVVLIICGLIIPRLIIQTFGSSVNGVISSISQFLGFIVLLEAGVGGVVRAALYKPLANNDSISISKIIKATEKFFRIVALIYIFYLISIAIIFPYIVNNEFDNFFTLTLVLIIGISTIIQYYFGISYQILLIADQKQYINSLLQIVTVIINAIIAVVLIKLGSSIQIVKLGSAIIFILRPIILNLYVNHKYKIIKKCNADNNAIKQRWDGLGHHVAYLVRINSDIITLTLFLNVKEVSVYSIYYMVVYGIENLVATFSSGLEAAFGNMIAKDEKESLSKNFRIFEFSSFTLTTILFTSTALLILPFISLYTKGITDVSYYRPAFAYFFILAHAIYCIRIPYNSVVLAAGHYKKTRNGAFVESFIYVLLSIFFVNLFGLVGVAIGPLCAMLFRTVQYAIYLSKNILKRTIWEFVKRVIVYTTSSFVAILIINFLPSIIIDSYIKWLIYAIIILAITTTITLIIGALFYKNDIKDIFIVIKGLKKAMSRRGPLKI